MAGWKTWNLLNPQSLAQAFDTAYREIYTTDVVDSEILDTSVLTTEPILGIDGALFFNYKYSNNGVRIAPANQRQPGQNENSDDMYGLGVDYQTASTGGHKSGSTGIWNGEASVKNNVASCQGSDHGASCGMADVVSYKYSIYIKTSGTTSGRRLLKENRLIAEA
eukprot:UN30463